LYNLRDMRELRKNFNAEGAEVFSQSSLRKKVAEALCLHKNKFQEVI
jgi:hypothetical protein